MSVLFVTPTFETGVHGGVQMSAKLAWEALRESVSGGRAELLAYGNAAGGSTVPSKISFLSRAARLRTGFDLILFWHIGLVKALSMMNTRAARVMVFLHGIEAWSSLDGITARLLEGTHLFLTNSDHTWRRFISSNPRFANYPHQTVPLGIGSPVDQPVPQPGVPPAALMLGRLERRENYKGHIETIQAWPLVLASEPNAELWIAGDGNLLADLKESVRRIGVEDSVKFFGTVSEKRKQELLVASRCLALPSRGEGFGLVYLEAMRLGRPCLVSTSDAGREVTNPPEAGMAVDVGDSAAIAASLATLLRSDSAWPAWSVNARLRYETRFTANHFKQRLVAACLPPARDPLASAALAG
ncbi:MAG: glycosyltransferase family 4 protein [Acidobacteriaceae bacterium]|nr:glycosyltransferase family 4 protein [Acidobacteriaceae bacterium]